jgi:hypothetical protein
MRKTSSASLLAALLASPGSVIALATMAPSAPRDILPFIADDYPQALATARAQSKPIFLEAWAPW